MKTTYFLFGIEACRILEEEGEDSLFEWVEENTEFDIFAATPETTPESLIDAYDGWGRYATITEYLYLRLQ